MAKIFELDAEKGYFDTVTGLVPDTKTAPISTNLKGKCFDGNRSTQIAYNTLDFTSLINDRIVFEYSIVQSSRIVGGTISNVYNSGVFTTINTDHFSILYLNNGVGITVRYVDDTYSGNIIVNGSKKLGIGIYNHVVIEFIKSTKTINCYQNGILTTTVLPKEFKLVLSGIKRILGYMTGALPAGLEINYFRIYDTLPNISELYQDFLARSVKSIPTTKQYVKPTKSSESGLIAHYTFNDKGKVITDISGNGNHATLSNQCSVTRERTGMRPARFNGTSTNTPAISIVGDYSIIHKYRNYKTGGSADFVCYGTNFGIWTFPPTTVELNDGVDKILTTSYPVPVSGNIIITRSGTTVSLYINGVFVNSITNSSNLNIQNILGRDLFNKRYHNSVREEFKVYNRALSLDEIKVYHNKWASKPVISQQFVNEGADGITKSLDKELIKKSGTYKIVKEAVGNSIIAKGTSYLECVTAGAVGIPNSNCYGTVEFSYYKANNSASARIFYMSTKMVANAANSYDILIDTNRVVYMTRTGVATLTQTAAGYIAFATMYRFRVTRTIAGVFTTYIKGGTFTDWTLISVTGGSGSNPVTNTATTACNSFVMLMGAGDRIADIKIYPSVVV